MRFKDQGIVFDAMVAPANGRSCAFTSIARLADGAVLVGFRNGSGRDVPDGRLRVMRSRDEGATWETLHAGLTATVDGIVGNLYSGYFTELAPGRLLLTAVWVDRSNPALSFVNAETAGVLPMRVLIAESGDGGATLGPWRLVDLTPHEGSSCTGPVFRLPDGALALPYESWKEYDDPRPGLHGAHLRISRDEGQTWPEIATVAADPDGRMFYWDQRIAVHPETGRLVAMFWTHDRTVEQDVENHIARGEADGSGWTTPAATGWRGQHCEPIALGGDRLAAVYVHRHDPPSLRAVLSEDFGRTWRSESEVVFYDSSVGTEPGSEGSRAFEDFWQDMMAWRFGHPRGVALPNGDVLVAYYAGDERAASVHWARIGV
ncbi:MAG: sialidase family protein [Thermomicrobiales bacterium]